MTREEYEEITSKVGSNDPIERIRANLLIKMFPDYGRKYEVTTSTVDTFSTMLLEVLHKEEVM